MMMKSPILAGCVIRPGTVFGGHANVPSELFCTIAGPVPKFKVKTPGEAGAMATCPCPLPPGAVTVMFAGMPGGMSQGTCALICCGPAKNKGAGSLLNVTETPPSEAVSGIVSACDIPDARFDPKIDTIDPGVTGTPGVKLAPFTVLELVITGCPSTPPTRNIPAIMSIYSFTVNPAFKINL